ncbi:MAG: Ig-like domain-containing protein [Prevotellaceae bacterium]|jgi:hypothetical protein|nr:Ig-like domain-containing protein [Prevotellaceae bacterium]
MKKKNVLILLLLSISIGLLLFSPSCANTTTPPSGGIKDTIPPVLVGTKPAYNAVQFTGKRIELQFNEYVKLTDVASQVFISPPQAKRLQPVVRGKSVVVPFTIPLDSNTTYSISFGNSIADNNEGNPFGTYTFSFSTGNEIDSLLFSGYVVDAMTLLPLDNISIMLHTNDADTTIYKTLPRALAKTDLWGYFAAVNLKPIPYHVFGVEDVNRNNKYDPGNEMVGFLDSLFIPNVVMVPDSAAMERINPKDTLKMLSRPIERTIYLFKELSKRQILREKARPQPRYFYFTFSVPNTQINSIQVEGVDSLSLICEHSLLKDTIRYWIKGQHVPDTLKGIINYMKTDSLNQLSLEDEKFSLLLAKPAQPQGGISRSNTPRTPTVDTTRKEILKLDVIYKGEEVEQTGVIFSFSAYPVEIDPDKISLSYKTTRNEVIKTPFTFHKDTLNGCKYSLVPQKWTPAVTYDLDVPQGIFKDVYGFTNDSLNKKITLLDSDNFGSISITLQGGEGKYIVELLPATRDRVNRRLHLSAGEKGIFPYLTDGTYVVRITEDRNGNGMWDTGSIDQRIQPERVRFFRFENGVDLIEIKDKRELEQIIDIDELFNNDTTPIVPAKTKR